MYLGLKVQNGDEQLRAAHSSWVRWPAVSHCSSSGACLCVPPVSCVFVCLCICRCILVCIYICVCVYILVRILSGFADRRSLTAAAAACSTPQTISRDHQPLWHSFACFVKVALRIKCKLARPRWEVISRNMCVRISRRTFLVCSQQSSVTADRNMLQARGSRCKPDAQTVSTANSLDTANCL